LKNTEIKASRISLEVANSVFPKLISLFIVVAPIPFGCQFVGYLFERVFFYGKDELALQAFPSRYCVLWLCGSVYGVFTGCIRTMAKKY